MEIPRELRAGDILLSEQQREAIELALNSSLSIILGGAGCGKTTLIEAIVHCFRERNDAFVPYVVAAPTGKAARNLTERTGIEARTGPRRAWEKPRCKLSGCRFVELHRTGRRR